MTDAETIIQNDSDISDKSFNEEILLNVDNINEEITLSASDGFNYYKINVLEQQIVDLELQKSKLTEENEHLQKTIFSTKNDLQTRNEHIMRSFEEMKKDKESMVLKFAQSEQKCMELQRKVKEFSGKLLEKTHNVDQLSAEKDKLNKELRSRISDYSSYEKELNNLKISLSIAEQKLKNEDLKYKEEVERNKDIKKKNEELYRSILVMKEENSTLRANCQEIVKTYQDSEDMRSNSLTSSIKQIKEELKKCNEEKKDAVDNFNKVNSELQATKQTINNHIQEIRIMKDKVKQGEADRICQDETIKQLKDTLKSLNFVKDQLNDRISHLEPLESQITQLSQERSRLTAANEELRKTVDDSESLTKSLRQKESELLEFIQSLSNKNAQIQTEKQELIKENEKDKQQISKFDQKYKDAFIKINFWEEKSKSESKTWSDDKEKFVNEISGLKGELTIANQKVLDLEDQIYSLNKRHKAHIKDLTRQLTKSGSIDLGKTSLQSEKCKRDLINEKAKSSSYSTSDESQNSTSNLNECDETYVKDSKDSDRDRMPIHNTLPIINKTRLACAEKFESSNLCRTPEIQLIEPHNQVFIEKIVRLQRINAKLQDKIDFLGEHTAQLTQDIQKKSFLLKYLFSQIEEKVSLKSDSVDENHLMMSKKGGIMASVYSSRPADDSMTLELSLEISKQLQSVLEDTTIKNITLKESINTLGEEISKLNEENRSLKKQLGGS